MEDLATKLLRVEGELELLQEQITTYQQMLAAAGEEIVALKQEIGSCNKDLRKLGEYALKTFQLLEAEQEKVQQLEKSLTASKILPQRSANFSLSKSQQ